MRLEGKVAIVTGAAGGLGRATAELFAEEGAVVYATDVAAGDFSPDTIRHREHDITAEDEWALLVAETIADAGRIDVLVNNAGITGTTLELAETPLDEWDAVIRTNLTGAFLGMRAVIPHMQARQAGSIVNIASIRAFHPNRGLAAYHAAKSGLRGLSRHAALKYAADGIRVNTIFPGVMDTPMLGANRDVAAAHVALIPLGRIGLAAEVARGSLYLASGESSYVTGAELVIDGGLSI
jgi:NAD(P)-dependent dehydrogenase (short-subunit alcohol dehydrogenase family)